MKYHIISLSVLLLFISSCASKIDFELVPPAGEDYNTELLLSEIATAINTDPNAGTSRNHYVELYNGTGETVNLGEYAIGYQASTDLTTLADWTFPGGNFITLSGNLKHDTCYVIASPQANTTAVPRNIEWGTTSTAAANASTPLQLSGNSAIALLKKDATGSITLNGNAYKIIDVFGSPLTGRLTATGSSSTRNNLIWTVAGETDTRNRTFWRKKSIKKPTTDWQLAKGTTPIDGEWELSADRDWKYNNVGLPTN